MDKLTTPQMIALIALMTSVKISFFLYVGLSSGIFEKNSIEVRLMRIVDAIALTTLAACAVFGNIFAFPKQN